MSGKDEIREAEFFSIEDGSNYCTHGKVVHIHGFMWRGDGRWNYTEFVFCIIPVDDFVKGYAESKMAFVDEQEAEVTQYNYELTGAAVDDLLGDGGAILKYEDITADTPIGEYTRYDD